MKDVWGSCGSEACGPPQSCASCTLPLAIPQAFSQMRAVLFILQSVDNICDCFLSAPSASPHLYFTSSPGAPAPGAPPLKLSLARLINSEWKHVLFHITQLVSSLRSPTPVAPQGNQSEDGAFPDSQEKPG